MLSAVSLLSGLMWLSYGASVVLVLLPWEQSWYPLYFLVAHLVSIGLGFLVVRSRQTNNSLLWGGKAALLAFCMPLAGVPFFMVIAFTSHGIHQDSLMEYEEHVAYNVEPDALVPSEIQQEAFLQEKLNIQSFVDVIHSKGQVEEKIRALNTLPSQASPNIVNMVKIAARDKSPEVKFIAASVIKKIEKPMLEEMQFWSEETKAHEGNIDGWVNLGNLYFNYCYLGIPDNVNMAHYTQMAVDAYKKALVLAPERVDLLLAVGKVLVKQQKLEEALGYIERFIEQKPKDSNGHLWKAEVFFQKRDFRALRMLFQKVQDDGAEGWGMFNAIRAVWV
ncbi:MAG: hypothetical protein HQK83_09355 [Fibrobacteria bacterium]|nr:hypothetical protein [Fibrobacteria bacterium]